MRRSIWRWSDARPRRSALALNRGWPIKADCIWVDVANYSLGKIAILHSMQGEARSVGEATPGGSE